MTQPTNGAPDEASVPQSLRDCRDHLVNFRAALEMWQADHKAYPPTLESLVPNYLHHIPAGPGGRSDEWDYQPGPDGFLIVLRVGQTELRCDADGVQQRDVGP